MASPLPIKKPNGADKRDDKVQPKREPADLQHPEPQNNQPEKPNLLPNAQPNDDEGPDFIPRPAPAPQANTKLAITTFGGSGAGKSTWGKSFIGLKNSNPPKTLKIKSPGDKHVVSSPDSPVRVEVEFIDPPGIGDTTSVEKSLSPLLIEQLRRMKSKSNPAEPLLIYGFYFLVNNRVTEQDLRAMEILSDYLILIPVLARADSYRSGLKDVQLALRQDILNAKKGTRTYWDEEQQKEISLTVPPMNINIEDVPFPKSLEDKLEKINPLWEWKYPYPVMGCKCTYSNDHSSVTLRWDDMKLSATLPLQEALLFNPVEDPDLRGAEGIPRGFFGSKALLTKKEHLLSWMSFSAWKKNYMPFFWLHGFEFVLLLFGIAVPCLVLYIYFTRY